MQCLAQIGQARLLCQPRGVSHCGVGQFQNDFELSWWGSHNETSCGLVTSSPPLTWLILLSVCDVLGPLENVAFDEGGE